GANMVAETPPSATSPRTMRPRALRRSFTTTFMLPLRNVRSEKEWGARKSRELSGRDDLPKGGSSHDGRRAKGGICNQPWASYRPVPPAGRSLQMAWFTALSPPLKSYYNRGGGRPVAAIRWVSADISCRGSRLCERDRLTRIGRMAPRRRCGKHLIRD